MPAWMTSGGARICGFEVRGGVEAVTQGIDLWSKPYIIKRRDGSKMCLILMDTQGLWDKKTLNSFNCILFGLSSVLSSYAIFNQKIHFFGKSGSRIDDKSVFDNHSS